MNKIIIVRSESDPRCAFVGRKTDTGLIKTKAKSYLFFESSSPLGRGGGGEEVQVISGGTDLASPSSPRPRPPPPLFLMRKHVLELLLFSFCFLSYLLFRLSFSLFFSSCPIASFYLFFSFFIPCYLSYFFLSLSPLLFPLFSSPSSSSLLPQPPQTPAGRVGVRSGRGPREATGGSPSPS